MEETLDLLTRGATFWSGAGGTQHTERVRTGPGNTLQRMEKH